MLKTITLKTVCLGSAAVVLSGCSWLGYTSDGYGGGYNTGQYGNTYGGQYGNANYGQAQTIQQAHTSKWSMTGMVGTDFVVGGDAVTGDKTPFSPTTNMRTVPMKKAYKTGFRGELGANYQLNDRQDLTLNGFYQTAEGKNIILADTQIDAIRGRLSDYTSYGAEAGFRHTLNPVRMPIMHNVNPYFEGRLGIAQVEDIRIEDMSINGAASTTPVDFYKSRLVPTASGLVGVEKAVSTNSFIGVETGLRYIGEPGTDNTGVGFQGANSGGARWSVPVQLRGRYRF